MSTRVNVVWDKQAHLRVSVQHELADLVQRELAARPHLRDVEWVEVNLLQVARRQDLDVHGPARVAATLDMLPQVALRVVRVLTAYAHSLVVRELLRSLLREPMILHTQNLSAHGSELEKNVEDGP